MPAGKTKSRKGKKPAPKRTKTEEDIIEVFHQFDKDGSGCVDMTELRDMLFVLGQCATEADVEAIMCEVDEDKNGVIDLEEFMTLMKTCLKDEEQCHDELLESFEIFDRNGDGVIDRRELEYVLRNTGEKLPKSTIDFVFNRLDKDGSGTIDYQEFSNVMKDGLWGDLEDNKPDKKSSKKK